MFSSHTFFFSVNSITFHFVLLPTSSSPSSSPSPSISLYVTPFSTSFSLFLNYASTFNTLSAPSLSLYVFHFSSFLPPSNISFSFSTLPPFHQFPCLSTWPPLILSFHPFPFILLFIFAFQPLITSPQHFHSPVVFPLFIHLHTLFSPFSLLCLSSLYPLIQSSNPLLSLLFSFILSLPNLLCPCFFITFCILLLYYHLPSRLIFSFLRLLFFTLVLFLFI